MVSERDRILNLVEYLNSIGIIVNIGKNRARGNKGVFVANNHSWRIDVSKNLSDEEVIGVLAHEYAHYVHYQYDKTLNSLDFFNNDIDDDFLEELIQPTVDLISKKSISPLFELKNSLNNDIRLLLNQVRVKYPDFMLTKSHKRLLADINRCGLKYLLKNDRVKVFHGFSFILYSIDKLEEDFPFVDAAIKAFLKIKSKQRAIKRINSRISRLNRYYNSPTELFARAFELYVSDRGRLAKIAPDVCSKFNTFMESNNKNLLKDFCSYIN